MCCVVATYGRIEFGCIFSGLAIAVAVHLLSPTAREARKKTIIPVEPNASAHLLFKIANGFTLQPII